MFRVTADSLQAYLDFDPKRKQDLVNLDELIRKAAPALKRYFHKGTPEGHGGMRMRMIGYGKFRYATKSGEVVEWPVIGIALQRNYISVYVAVTKEGAPIVPGYSGKLGESRMGGNNFSFMKFDDLKQDATVSLIGDIARAFALDPENPVRYMQGS